MKGTQAAQAKTEPANHVPPQTKAPGRPELVVGALVKCSQLPATYRITDVDAKTCTLDLGDGKKQAFEKWRLTLVTPEQAKQEPAKKQLPQQLATLPQAPKARKVGDKVRCPLLVLDRELVIETIEGSSYTLVDETAKDGEKYVADDWMLRDGPELKKEEAKQSGEGYHKLLTDDMVPALQRPQMRTPGAVRTQATTARAGKDVRDKAFAQEADFKDTARIDVKSRCSESGVEITYEIRSNPSYMCGRQYKDGTKEVKDLVPVMLEYANDAFADTIDAVEPTPELNLYRATATYTWDCLAAMLPGVAKTGGKAQDRVLAAYSQLGVKAQWLANTTGTNSPNHTSGGVFQKGGSGKVPLVKVTLDALEKTEETQRNTEWNMGEQLAPGRAAFDKFEAIMKEGKELATTLEAESEFLVEDGDFKQILQRMQGLAATPSYWPKFGIVEMEAGKAKEYSDTYYDVQEADDKSADFALLQAGVVLRERHVAASDTDDVFLLAVKGKSQEKNGEKIRLAAQTNLDRKKVLADEGKSSQLTETGQAQLDAFVQDTSVDNAVGRTLDHALGGDGKAGGHMMQDKMGAHGHVKPVLRIESMRYKFVMKLEGGTAIDFSADHAKGYRIDPATSKPVEDKHAPQLFSFEFGVGHPGLTASSTASNGGGASGGTVKRVLEQFGQSTKKTPDVQRPYHVAADLENPALFEKKDYKQFQALRDGVIKDALGRKKEALAAGGNKAQVLAQKLGMITSAKDQKRE